MEASNFSIIIPAYNEEVAIEKVLKDLINLYGQAEIILVNDGSSDKTAQIASKFSRVKLVNHRHNRGYGASLKTGIQSASTDMLCFYDADGQHDPEDVGRLIEASENADMVVGSRGISAFKNWYRAWGKLVLHFVSNFLVEQKIPDLNSGLRVVKKEVVLKYTHLLPDGFSASTTITMALLSRGYNVKFIPISVKKREGKSQVNQLRDGSITIKSILRIIMLFNPLRFFISAGIFFAALGMIYGLFKAFTNNKLGFPVGALLIVFAGILSFIFGLLADQVSQLRLERFEKS